MIEIRDRVVGDDIIVKFTLAGIDNLVCFAWGIQHAITRFKVARQFARANLSRSRDY